MRKRSAFFIALAMMVFFLRAAKAEYSVFVPRTEYPQKYSVMVDHQPFDAKELRTLDSYIQTVFRPFRDADPMVCESVPRGESGQNDRRVCTIATKGGATLTLSDKILTWSKVGSVYIRGYQVSVACWNDCANTPPEPP